MPIHQYLDVSTGNITSLDADILTDPRDQPVVIHVHPYGFWVNVQHETTINNRVKKQNALKERGYSPAFLKLYNTAHRKGCNWINIDRDGEPEPGLESFNW